MMKPQNKPGNLDALYPKAIARFKKLSLTEQTAYVIGLFQADGSFVCTLDRGVFRTFFSFSQSSKNKVVLALVCYFLRTHLEIADIAIPPEKTSRALRVQWTDKTDVEKFVDFLIQHQKTIPLMGAKHFDYLCIKAIIRIQNTQRYSGAVKNAKLLDIKYAMHQPNAATRVDTPSHARNRYTREHWEKELRLLNSSVNAAKAELDSFSSQVDLQTRELEQKIKDQTLTLEPYYVTGICEGDGSLGFGLRIDRSFSKSSNKPLVLELSFQLASDGESEITLACVFDYFNIREPISRISKPESNVWLIRYSQQNNTLETILYHFINHPYFIQEKIKRHNFFIRLVKDNYLTKTKAKFTKDQILGYAKIICDLEGKGKKRAYSFEDLEKAIDEYYS